MINEFLDNIQQRMADAFHGVLDYAFLGEWYLFCLAVLAACVIVGYFLPFQWVRASLGFIVLLAGAFLAGAQVMFNHMRGDTQNYRDKIKKLESQQAKKGGGFFS